MRFLFFLILFVWNYSMLAQPFHKSGRLPLYNISPDEYQLKHPQNHCILVASDGLVYVGNNGGLLVYNGVEWSKVYNQEKKILALEESSDKIIFAGGENELGYIQENAKGEMEYKSLLDEIPDSLRSFGRMNLIKALNNSLFIICENRIFEFQSKKLIAVSKKLNFGGCFTFQNDLYINDIGKGLLKWNDQEYIEFDGDYVFSKGSIFKIINNAIVSFGSSRVIIFSLPEKGKAVQKEIIDYEFSNSPISIKDVLVYNNNVLFGTEDEGLLIIDENFQLLKRINSANSELQIDFIRKMFIDSSSNLWLALDKGVSVIDLNSPFSIYKSSENLRGMVNDVIKFENSIFVGGSQGLIKLDIQSENKFVTAVEVTGECWSLEVINDLNDKLSFATDNTIEILNESGYADTILGALPWDIAHSKYNKNRIWIGNDDGVITSILTNGKYEEEFKNNTIQKQIRKIVTLKNGDVWLGARGKVAGVYFINETNLDTSIISNPKFYDSTYGFPNVPYVFPFLIHDEVFFATTRGIFEFDSMSNTFSKSDKFKHPFNLQERNILNMYPAGKNAVWLTSKDRDAESFQNGIYNFETGEWVYKPYMDLSSAVQFSAYYDSVNQELWVGGSEGLFRIKNLNPKPIKSYTAFISQVKYDPDSILFGGHVFEGFINNTYNYSKKPLRFSFSANSYKRKDDLKFKYMLEGFDEVWTDWSEEAEAVYTNLPGGSYTMRVKAIDFFENESEEASFSFTILPPWYLTTWAYTLYFFGFIGFVYAAIRVSTISLQRVIKENTKEIVAQKDEIEAKNTVLESQKGRIEKQNLNILDSIRYAKRIQMATLPAEDKIQKSVENAWVMYRPKDIVSGDFYWLENYKDEKTEKTLIAAVDCTGHGVPGAFMSIIGYNGLNRVVREYRLNRPSEVLDRLNEIITTTLNQQGAQREEIKDGMDMSLCSLDRKNLKLEYAGAHNSLYVIRKGEEKLIVDGEAQASIMNDKGHNLFEIKADKQPIGAFENRKNFTNHEIQLLKDDMIVLFTDGYADQFGGPKGKKFFYKPFKRLLLSIADEDVIKQHEIIENTFNDWISYPDSNGDAHEQVDDICVIGVRV
ncbi:SpoIIE family protein phosphatase [Hyphobacterium sp. CCMP332]|nr:SpoIIE family protein phosphatase [Hyphobacterium sp. CCMP332]